eukprot:SAG31_NODE_103_length_25164_cov_12.124317_19_plen_217_part_00
MDIEDIDVALLATGKLHSILATPGGADGRSGGAASNDIGRKDLTRARRRLYKAADVKQLHIELTDKCNAACPQCARTIVSRDHGVSVNPQLPLTELTEADVRNIFPARFLAHVKVINLCGNYGDPSAARDLLPICEYLAAACHSQLQLIIHTNGGARSAKYWARLGRLYARLPADRGSAVHFGIDGGLLSPPPPPPPPRSAFFVSAMILYDINVSA